MAIGLGLTLIHLISIPVTNTSMNPARSTSQAIFVGDGALGQIWLFRIAPIVGAILAGIVYKILSPEDDVEQIVLSENEDSLKDSTVKEEVVEVL